MSYDAKHTRYCDECGRAIIKAHRRHCGSDYCASCYPRVFVRRPCRLCGELARFHKNTAVAELVCASCARQRRTCIRCGKPLPKAARLVDGGAICGACAPHFNEPKPCPRCGHPSRRLASAPKHGVNEKICDRCRNRLTHRTCSICHRYRPVAGELPDGKPYCAVCIPDAPMTHQCPGCNELVPGDGHGRCLRCLNRERVARETGLQRLVLSKEWSRELYAAFGEWLTALHPGHRRLLGLLRKHFPFFETLDTACDCVEEVTGQALLDSFQVSGLRAHALPIRYLAESCGVVISHERKCAHAEQRRVTDLLERYRSEPWGPSLEQYAEWLGSRGTATRTSRLYLSTAATFCRMELGHKCASHTASMLQRFLKHRPGLRANLYSWNTFCNESQSAAIAMPSVRARRRGPKTVGDLAKLLVRIEAIGLGSASVSLLERALAKAFGYSVKRFGSLQWSINHDIADVWLSCDSERLRVPDRIRPIAREWVKRGRPSHNGS